MRSALMVTPALWTVVLFACLLVGGCGGSVWEFDDGTTVINETDHVEIKRIDGSGEEIWR